MGTDQKNNPNYIQIADRIEDQIRKGEKLPGEKLESIRQLAATEGVSINTVRSAMEVLCQTELVISKPRVGLIVAENQQKPDFEAFEYFKPDSRLAHQSRQWINALVSSNAASDYFVNMVLPTDSAMYKSFQRCYRKMLGKIPDQSIESSAGNLQLRNKISSLLAIRRMAIKANAIQITNGCQNAIEHALRLVCEAGDAVAIPTPAYPGYLALLSILKLKVIEIPMTPGGPDPRILMQVMQSGEIKALIINPICHNPTGISLNEQYKRNIAVLAGQNQVAIVEDDICADLSFSESHPRPIASYDKHGWVILVSSISKIIGDSERIGWCCPGRFKDAYMTQFAVSQIANSHYRQMALACYLNGSRYPSQLRQRKRMNKSAIDETIQILDNLLDEKISITKSSGGYALWIRLNNNLNAVDIRTQAQQQGIDFLPGVFFSLENRFQDYLRLVIIPPLTEKHKMGLQKFAEIILGNQT